MKGLSARSAADRPARRAPGRLVLTLIALLTFTIQGYVTQTHIHIPLLRGHGEFAASGLPSPGRIKTVAAQNRERDRTPERNDPAHCPLCQDILRAGTFFVPAAPILALPSLVAQIGSAVIAIEASIATASHFWHGRAPPHA